MHSKLPQYQRFRLNPFLFIRGNRIRKRLETLRRGKRGKRGNTNVVWGEYGQDVIIQGASSLLPVCIFRSYHHHSIFFLFFEISISFWMDWIGWVEAEGKYLFVHQTVNIVCKGIEKTV